MIFAKRFRYRFGDSCARDLAIAHNCPRSNTKGMHGGNSTFSRGTHARIPAIRNGDHAGDGTSPVAIAHGSKRTRQIALSIGRRQIGRSRLAKSIAKAEEIDVKLTPK